MSSESPDVVLYDASSNALAVQNATAIPTSTPALMIAGSDGTNSRYILIDASGRQVIAGAGVAGTPAGGVLTIQGVSGGTVIPISGTVTANAGTGSFTVVQATASNLRAQTSSESNTAAAPPTQATYTGGSVTTAAPTYTTGQMNALSLTTTGLLRIDGSGVTQPVSGTVTATQVTAANLNATIVGTTAAGSGASSGLVTIQGNASGTPVPVTFTSTVSDATATGALGALNATVQITTAGYSGVGMQLAAGTLIGTLVAESSYDGGTTWNAITFNDTVTGNNTANIVFASSNTAVAKSFIGSGGTGLTRVRVSVYTSGTANVTLRASQVREPSTLTSGPQAGNLPPAVAFIGASVTTTVPTYTTGTLNALSLTTSGLLRIDGSGVTQPISGTVTSNIGTTNGLALDATLLAMSLVDNSTFTDSTTRVQPVGYIFDEVAGTALTENDIAAARIDSKRAQVGVIEDGTTRGTRATIKAASTAAVATDTALVVAISPNNPIVTSNTDTTATGALGALNAAVQISVQGHSTAGFQLAAGTLIGTIVAEASFDGGTTWNATYVDQATGNKVNNIIFASSNTATAATIVGVGGSGLYRIRISAYTSGTANITLRTSVAADPSTLTGGTPNATTQPPTATQIAGWDGTTYRVPAVKASGVGAVTTDQALVVVVSPNNTVATTFADTTSSGTLNALNTTVSVSTAGHSGVAMQLSAGTLIGTIVPEISVDGGTTWIATEFTDPTTDLTVTSIVFASNNTAQTQIINLAGGVSNARVRVSAFTSGTASAAVRASAAGTDTIDYSGVAGSSNFPSNTALVGGSVTTAAPTYTAGQLNNLSLTTAGALRVDGSGSPQPISAVGYSSFIPDPQSDPTGSIDSLISDGAGSLQIRGPVLSDEGSLRDDFSGSGLTTAITGTLTFTNGSTTVTGSGSVFQTELTSDHYIKKTADVEANYVRIASVDSNTSLTLLTPYIGTTASTTGVYSRWATTATGGTVTVATSEVLLASSTASGNIAQILHLGDYPPYTLNFRARITQRIANQTGTIGFQDNATTPTKQAVVIFDGTTSTSVKFRTSYSAVAAEIQETVVLLTTGLDTSQTLQYQIDLSSNTAVLSINGSIVATHSNHIPGPYDDMNIVGRISNAAVVTTTTLAIDTIFFQNLDQLQITNSFTGEPLKVLVVPTANTAVFGIRDGSVATAAATLVPIRTTTYTEQLTNAQRSIVSSSALDTAAGTGAQTVRITYLDVLMAGPFTETIILNGITAVNTVGTNICFIEKIEVISSGTVNANAGTITLKAAVAGGGATIGSINIGDNRTFWAHHYTPNGKTTNITVMTAGAKAASGNVFIRSVNPILAASTEIQITETFRTTLGAPSFPRSYISPIQISGPARLIMYMLPDSGTATTTYGSFDFYDQ